MTTTTSTQDRDLLQALRSDLQIAQDMVTQMANDVSAGTSATTEELRAMLRQVVRDARVAMTELDASHTSDRSRLLTATREQLTDWRAALDDLRVQMNLGGMTSRDRAQEAIAAAERAWSAAQHRVDVARDDLGTSWETLRDGITESMRQLADAVRAAIRS